MKSKQDKITLEINKRKIQASMKETPNCFGECLTVGDVYEVLDIQKAKLREDIEGRIKDYEDKLKLLEGKREEKQRKLDFSGEWDIERVIAKILVLKELLKSLEDEKQ